MLIYIYICVCVCTCACVYVGGKNPQITENRISSSEIKEKKHLIDARKQIERDMERFKACEREMKTKAFSKEGLQLQASKKDPKERARNEARDWLNSSIDELNSQIDNFEADMEGLSVKKGKAKPAKLIQLESFVNKHREHIKCLEQLIRLVDRKEVTPDEIDDLKEMISDYIERNAEDDTLFEMDVDDIYYTVMDKLHGLEDLGSQHTGQQSIGYLEDAGPALDISNATHHQGSDANVHSSVSSTTSKKDKGEKEKKSKDKESSSSKASKESDASAKTSATQQNAGDDGSKTSRKLQANGKTAAVPLSQQQQQQQQQRTKEDAASVAPAGGVTNAIPYKQLVGQANAAQYQASMAQSIAGTASQQQAMAKYNTAGAKKMLDQSAAAGLKFQQPVPPQQPWSGSAAHGATGVGGGHLGDASANERDGVTGPRGFQQQQQQVASAAGIAAGSTHSRNQAHQRQHDGERSGVDETLDALGAKAGIAGIGPRQAMHTPPSDPQQSTNFEKEMMFAMQLLESSVRRVPRANDLFLTSGMVASKDPIQTPPSFPQDRAPLLENEALYEKLHVDTLFYIFYHMQGTYYQFLAARELKRQSWRYHKKYGTWFLRHAEPKMITDDFEQGSYIFFDHRFFHDDYNNSSSWRQKVKNDFCFEYIYLENELAPAGSL